MEASGPSSGKQKSNTNIIINILGTAIAISTLTLPLFFIINLSQNQLDQSLQSSKVLTSQT